MKKIIFLITILLLGLGYYFYQKNHSQIITHEELIRLKKAAKENAPAQENVPLTLKTNEQSSEALLQKEPEVKVYETKDEKFEAFDRMEKGWLNSVSKLLTAKEYLVYEDLRNLNEKEKADAYKAYHDYLRSKYGNNFKYNISEDQSIREKKINEKYLKDLAKLIGPEKFKKYLATKDQYNENLRRETKGKSFLVIEF